MSRGEYKGCTPGKALNRHLVWLQHLHQIGDSVFESSPHAFLASRYGGDIPILIGMGVQPHNVYAIEKEWSQYKHLIDRQEVEGFSLYTEKVESVIRDNPVQSVYLDFCGNIQGMSEATAKVVKCLPSHTALSITLFIGREHGKVDDREGVLLKLVRAHTKHQVTLVQSVSYRSSYGKDLGSLMGTWTFYLGRSVCRAKMRFDLTKMSDGHLNSIVSSPEGVKTFWSKQRSTAKNRSLGAFRANVARGATNPKRLARI